MNQIIVAPIEAITDNELTETERRVLLILFSFRNKSTDTVWPSTTAIAQMANISDVPRISKITSSLAEKGWLTKKKKGFTGCNEYVLTFPERLNSDTNLANFTKLVEKTKKEDSANLDKYNNTNLANFTKSNLANSAKYKEHTNEQTIEQTNNTSSNDSVDESKIHKPEPKEKIPIQEIVNLFNKKLPNLPAVKILSDKRKQQIKSRWQQNKNMQSLEAWEQFFDHVSKSDFLMGRSTGWSASFDWIFNPTNFVKIYEGNYSNSGRTTHATNQQRGSAGTSIGKVGHSDQTRADAREALERLNGSHGNSAVHAPG